MFKYARAPPRLQLACWVPLVCSLAVGNFHKGAFCANHCNTPQSPRHTGTLPACPMLQALPCPRRCLFQRAAARDRSVSSKIPRA
jgi:hypothetical protein